MLGGDRRNHFTPTFSGLAWSHGISKFAAVFCGLEDAQVHPNESSRLDVRTMWFRFMKWKSPLPKTGWKKSISIFLVPP